MSENHEELLSQLVQVRKYLRRYYRVYQEDLYEEAVAHKLNQRGIAARMQTSQAEVSRLEHGDPHISDLSRYVRALGGRLEVRAVAQENWLGNAWPYRSLPTQERIPRWPL